MGSLDCGSGAPGHGEVFGRPAFDHLVSRGRSASPSFRPTRPRSPRLPTPRSTSPRLRSRRTAAGWCSAPRRRAADRCSGCDRWIAWTRDLSRGPRTLSLPSGLRTAGRIGFFADGALKRIPAAGGPCRSSADNDGFRGATWGHATRFSWRQEWTGIACWTQPAEPSRRSRLSSVSSREQPSKSIISARRPALPLLGHRQRRSQWRVHRVGGWEDEETAAPDLTSAVYAPPGYVLFVDKDTLMAQAFDAERLELKGQPFFVAEHVGRNTSFLSAVSASLNGTIAYARLLSQNGRLSWVDRHGNSLGSPVTPEGDYTDFRLSPDETRLAGSLVDPKANVVDIWITDLARGGATRIGSGGGVTAAAIWSPDGARLAFRSNRTGVIEMYERSAAGGGVDRPLLPSDYSCRTPGLLPDGLVAGWTTPDRWFRQRPVADPPRARRETGEVHRLTRPRQDARQLFAGRPLSWPLTSNESGRFEIYAETVPRSDGKWPVSTNGGYEPRWRADGREIYYLSEDRTLMAVPLEPGSVISEPPGHCSRRTCPLASRDSHALRPEPRRPEISCQRERRMQGLQPITVVLNWTALLSK